MLVCQYHMLSFAMVQDGDGTKAAITAAITSNRESTTVTSPGKTAPVWKCFGLDWNDKKGKSSKALRKVYGKSVAHAGGMTNLKNHLYIWHWNKYNDLFASPDSTPKEPVLTQFMKPAQVEKLAANCNRARKLTAAIAEFIARDLRPITIVDRSGFSKLIDCRTTLRCALLSYNNCPHPEHVYTQ